MSSTLPRTLNDASADVAIPKLVDAHGGRIYGLGLRLCGNEQDAEDLVQETFLRAYRHWHQFEGRSDPATWLYSIAARACRRMNRRRVGEPARVESLSELLRAGEATVPDVGTGAADQLDEQVRREAEETVDRAIGGLPPMFRQPLVLKEIADFSLAEIAGILGIKEATAKTRVHRGRLMLRKALAARLPQRAAPPPDHSRRVCLDLLSLKQEALDRGAPFPLPGEVLCERCRATFATLDLGHGLCIDLGQGQLPETLRIVIMQRLMATELRQDR
jgi:RNA polymerase sigma-70 factor (ECF subfamily)